MRNPAQSIPGAPGCAPRLLIVDDDEPFLEALAGNFRDLGFETICHSDSAAALAWLLGGGACDAILLDWYLPGVPGLAFLRALRDEGNATPVIVLTAVCKDVIEDAALAGGALDFVNKSRRFSVLLHRLRIVLGCAGRDAGPPDEVRRGGLVMRRAGFRVVWKGRDVPLTSIEYLVVEMLASQPGVDFTYRRIYDAVHGDGGRAGAGQGYRVNVRSQIKRIRQKFQAVDARFGAIENYTGYGYRWREEKGRRPPLPREPLSLSR